MILGRGKHSRFKQSSTSHSSQCSKRHQDRHSRVVEVLARNRLVPERSRPQSRFPRVVMVARINYSSVLQYKTPGPAFPARGGVLKGRASESLHACILQSSALALQLSTRSFGELGKISRVDPSNANQASRIQGFLLEASSQSILATTKRGGALFPPIVCRLGHQMPFASNLQLIALLCSMLTSCTILDDNYQS